MENILNVAVNSGLGIASFILMGYVVYFVLNKINDTLNKITDTLVTIQTSLISLTERVTELEEKVGDK